MTVDQAIETLGTALQQLAAGGYVCSGQLAFIRPQTPGLVTTEARFSRGSVPTLELRTVRAAAATPTPPVHLPAIDAVARDEPVGGYTGDPCIKCGSPRMQRTGACTTCLDCGESGGCG